MTSTTRKTRKTVRMFDGAKYDTYVVGGKKHRAAEARRAAFDAKKAATRSWNKEAAKWARSEGVVPSGRAWAKITATADVSSLDIAALKKANRKDGLVFKAPKAVTAPEVKVAKGKKAPKAGSRKARSLAAKKGWETRRANAAALEVAEPAKVTKPKGRKAPKGKATTVTIRGMVLTEIGGKVQYNGVWTDTEWVRGLSDINEGAAAIKAEAKKAKKARKAQIAAKVDPAERVFREALAEVGLTEAQIDTAWALKTA